MFTHLVQNPSLQKELKLDPQAAIQIHYTIPKRNLKDRAEFGVSYKYTEYKVENKEWNYWDRVTDSLVLGTIPLLKQCTQIKNFPEKCDPPLKPLGLIVSAVDYFELGGNITFLDEVATPSDWKRLGIKHFSLPMKDFGADVPVECCLYTLDVMRECDQNGFSVYVHCKAGRGRSAMKEACYLAIYDPRCQNESVEKSLDIAIGILKDARIQVGLDDVKKAKAIAVITAARVIQKAQQKAVILEHKPETDLRKALDQCLGSTLVKAEIAQLTAFKELAIYGAFHERKTTGVTYRTFHIRDLFDVIYKATNADWLLNYHQHVANIRDANPWSVWDNSKNSFFGLGDVKVDKKIRRNLTHAFLNELVEYLAVKLKREPVEIFKLINPKPPKQEPSWNSAHFFKFATAGAAVAAVCAYQLAKGR